MPITKLTTADISSIVNSAYAQFTGDSGATLTDIRKLVDEGSNDIAALRSKFTGALIAQVTKNFYTQTSAESEYDDPFYQDSEEFGAICQMISATVPEATSNPAWQDFVSGTSTVGQYTVYLPTVKTTYFTKQEAWSVPLTITGEQWNQAFRDNAGLSEFVQFIHLVMGNAILAHREHMNEMNRNNFIAEKLNAEADQTIDGVHAVDLIALYAAETGASSAITVEDALASDTFKVFAMSKIGEYADYIKKQTSLFSADETVRFTPSDRVVCQMLSAFDKKLAVTQAGIYHNDLIKMPGYKTVASWQGLGDLTFDKLSKIHVKVAGGTVEQTGVVCLLVDKWAILHTIKKQRVASQHFDIEDVTQYSYQFVDQYMNNLSMPGIVFYMSDYTPS